jgi:hypothetical protein
MFDESWYNVMHMIFYDPYYCYFIFLKRFRFVRLKKAAMLSSRQLYDKLWKQKKENENLIELIAHEF